MSLPQNYKTIDSLSAAGDLSSHEYKLMKQTAAGVDLCGVGEAGLGSLVSGGQFKLPSAAGDQVSIAAYGEIPVMVGAAITAGAQFQSDANGKAIPLAAGIALGIVLESATADGQIIIARKY